MCKQSIPECQWWQSFSSHTAWVRVEVSSHYYAHNSSPLGSIYSKLYWRSVIQEIQLLYWNIISLARQPLAGKEGLDGLCWRTRLEHNMALKWVILNDALCHTFMWLFPLSPSLFQHYILAAQMVSLFQKLCWYWTRPILELVDNK